MYQGNRSNATSNRQGYQTRVFIPCAAQGEESVGEAVVAAAEPATTRVGFVGLGIMGYPMALNLLKAGYSLTIWNRSPEKCDNLAARGASVAETPAEVAAASDIVVAMLADPEACLAVALGPDGIAGEMGPGKGYVDVSTVDADTSMKVASAIRASGAAFLEAPVSGSKDAAKQGTLIFLTAGDKTLYDAATPLLDVMGKASFYLGDVGAGACMKLVVNMIMGSMMEAFSEGLILADSAGLEMTDVVEVLGLGAMACPLFALKGPAMCENKFPTAFPLKHQHKDMRLALQLAESLGRRTPVAAAATAEYSAAMDLRLGDKDFSAVLLAVALWNRK
jgi:glyoxylate/succinic semialdehyde reductase